jgi:Domain of unknown function (DUF4265)
MTSETKIFFRLEIDDDGYPPAAAESVWARHGEKEGEYIIDNIPFFTREATDGDIVAAHRDVDGVLWFHQVLQPSRNSLIRVVFFDKNAVEATREGLVGLECETEYSGPDNLLAVSIPPSADLAAVQGYLNRLKEEGAIEYEEPILWDRD